MTKRLKLMIGALAALALLLLFDRPAPVDAQVSEVAPRAAPKARALVVTSLAPALAASDAPVPDLFAGGAAPGQAVAATAAPAAREAQAAPTLLGFKEEDGVREAWLQIDGDVLGARTGTELKHRFRVLAMREDSVDLKDTASGAIRRIGFKERNE